MRCRENRKPKIGNRSHIEQSRVDWLLGVGCNVSLFVRQLLCQMNVSRLIMLFEFKSLYSKIIPMIFIVIMCLASKQLINVYVVNGNEKLPKLVWLVGWCVCACAFYVQCG